MTLTDVTPDRADLLTAYGRFYGQERFAVTFTASTTGEDAKRVTTRDWDKTAPLSDPEYAAGLIATRGRERNIAIVLRPSNLIVLECDTEADLIRIEQLNLPETLTVRSSKPYKRHFYFRPAPELDRIPYVAFRFESGKLTSDSGRYFLAPPSIHPTGAIYSFLVDHAPGDVAIATLPAGTYQELARTATEETDALKRAIHVDPSAKIQAGQRRDLIFRYACMLRRWGRSREAILAECLAFNQERCDPPVDARLVEVQVDGAMKLQGDQELRDAKPVQDEPLEPADSWTPVNLAFLPEHPPVQPTLGGVGIVYPGKRHVFSGSQESAKTLAAYAIAIQVVREGHTVAIIDFEMGAWDARNRLRELGATPDELSKILYVEPHEPATDERLARLALLKPSLVIIDAAAGAYNLQGLDDNKRADVERVVSLYIRGFWRAGVATIMLDHVVKDTETRGKYAIGSERKTGGADVHLGFETITPISRGGSGLYKIITHKDRGGFLQRGKLAHLELSSDPNTHHITWTFKRTEPESGVEFRPTRLMEKVSIYLEPQTEAVSRNTIETALGGNAVYVRKAVDALIREHFASETPGARGAKLIRNVRSYRENDPACNPQKSVTSSTSSDLVSTSSGRGQLTSSDLVPPLQGDEDEGRAETTSTSSVWEHELAPPDETLYDPAREEAP